MNKKSESSIPHFDLLKSPLEGTSLIEASAGTGKTYTIAGLFLRLVLEKGLSVNQILVVTFTEAATEELKDRIRNRLREAVDFLSGDHDGDEFLQGIIQNQNNPKSLVSRLKDAIRDFDESAIFTIHGFCKRMLHECAFESGVLFDTELITDQENLKTEIVEDFWRSHLYDTSPVFASYVMGKTGPDGLVSLLGNKISRPELKIIPCIDASDSSEQEAAFKASFAKACESWQKNKSEVENILLNHKGLNRNKYRKTSIPGWIEEMDDCLNSGDTDTSLFEKFIKFTPAGLLDAAKKGQETPNHLFFDLCKDLLEKQADLVNLFEKQLLHLQIELFDYLQQEMKKRKDSANIQSFDDLLLNLHKALFQEGGEVLAQKIRGKYHAALIDEFQDTDPVQYEIFKAVFHNHRILFLIGDPKQAIYGFRGADIFAYMEAKKDSNHAYTLGRNWRSEPELISAVNTLFQTSAQAFIYGEIPFEPVDSPEEKPDKDRLILSLDLSAADKGEKPPLQLWVVDAQKLTDSAAPVSKGFASCLIVKAVAGEISRLLDLGSQGKMCIGSKPVLPGDIAVLVRKNSEAKKIQEALLNLGIPGVVYSTGDIFDTHEALEIELVMTAIAHPRNERFMRTALVTDIFGLKGQELLDLAEDEDSWENWLTRFREYYHIWETRGFIHMFKFLISRENVLTRLMSLPDGERRTTNILHLSELIHQAGLEKKTGLDGLVKWLSEQRTRKDRRKEEHPLRLESDENAVKLVTIHKSKGLEYPIVFCPFTWEGAKNHKSKDPVLFHDENNNRSLTFDLGSDFIEQNRIYAVKEEIAENMRLLYVALTRARNRCYLVWGRFNLSETSAPAYLFHADAAEDDDVIAKTIEKYKSLNDKTLSEKLEKIKERSNGTINLSLIPDREGLVFSTGSSHETSLTCRNFTQDIRNDFRISSFSSLISGQHYRAELADYDDLDESTNNIKEMETEPDSPPSPAPSALNFFSFPRGAKPGTCLHEIFEYLDFTETKQEVIEKLVREKLDKYGFETLWTPGICRMIQKVLSIPLIKDQELTLSRISPKDRINELEFYFPLNAVSCENLRSVFAVNNMPEFSKDFSKQMAKLNFSPAQGFMKGYIDLVFQYNERFYIADWKSNFMGENYQNYSQDAIYRAMKESFYILQYHIYTLALHQYLANRISGYDYEKHFGGIFYLFLRGIDPKTGPDCGIFFDRPDKELILDLSEKMICL